MARITNPLARQVCLYLNDKGVRYIYDDDPCYCLQFNLPVPGALERVWVMVIVEGVFLTLIASPPVEPDPHDTETIRAVESMFARINYHLRAGSFDIIPDSGRTRFRVGAPYVDVPSFETLGMLLALARYVWELHGDEYLRLVFPEVLTQNNGGQDELVAQFDALFGDGGGNDGDEDAGASDDGDAGGDDDDADASDTDLTDRE